jgi:hypothetical protein
MVMRYAVVLALAACNFHEGSAPSQQPDGSGSGSDSGSQAVPGRRVDLVAGAGRTSAGSIHMQVEIGQAVPLQASSAGSAVLKGAPAVRP